MVVAKRARTGWGHVLFWALLLASPVSLADTPTSLFERPWRWRDEHGLSVSFSKWKGPPLVLSVFYAGCQFKCPRTIDKLQELDAALRHRGQRANFVLVTLDPHADAAELSAFKRARHLAEDSWHLLVGDEAQTRALCRLLGVHPAYDDGHVDHEVRIAIFDASGNIARHLEGWAFNADEAMQ
jgi:protein SCO1